MSHNIKLELEYVIRNSETIRWVSKELITLFIYFFVLYCYYRITGQYISWIFSMNVFVYASCVCLVAIARSYRWKWYSHATFHLTHSKVFIWRKNKNGFSDEIHIPHVCLRAILYTDMMILENEYEKHAKTSAHRHNDCRTLGATEWQW